MLTHHVAVTPGPIPEPPGEKRFPFGWPAFAILPNVASPPLRWTDAPQDKGAGRLRITVALDDREEKRVEAVLAESGEAIGVFDLRFADFLQTFEIVLTEDNTRAALSEGVRLRLISGSTPLYLFCGEGDDIPNLMRPHILTGGVKDRWAQFSYRLWSPDSLEAFGWHEGCILDGLMDMAEARPNCGARKAAEVHLAHYISNLGELVYEDPRSQPMDGRIYGIECTLTFAGLARVYPEHPLLSLATMFWKERTTANGAVTDGKIASAEGMYTVAYPMAVLAKIRGQDALAKMALQELRLRKERLVHEENIYLRFNAVTGERTFRNWARGYAWYLLGLTRALILLEGQDNIEDLRAECQRAALVAQSMQASGLWRCYMDDPSTTTETAGSAGIAAALALGARHGILGPEARMSAARALAALTPYLTPDGMLTGASPSNKGGESLQRTKYRVIQKTGMGLAAVLMAALV